MVADLYFVGHDDQVRTCMVGIDNPTCSLACAVIMIWQLMHQRFFDARLANDIGKTI